MKEKDTKAGRRSLLLIGFGIGLLIFLTVLVVNSFWEVKIPDIFRLLSDACITSAALVGGVGLLVFAADSGTFDMLGYGFRQFFDLFRPSSWKERYKSFYEYKQSKAERKRPVTHLLIVGIVFFALSWIFSMIWKNA